jgi:hypothetical protein
MHSLIKDDRPAKEAGANREEVARGVFFIVGAPRSGTTLLRTMLGAHARICIPHETEFFMRIPAAGGRGGLRAAFEAYASSEPFAHQDLPREELLAAIESGRCPSRAALFVEMASMHAARAGKARVGEKSPHHCRHVEAIACELPHAKFIHIYRDPRDVAASGVRVSWSSRSIVAQAKGWVGIQREHRRLMGVMARDRYTEVRFEDLVASPERELRRICGFLGEAYSPVMLGFAEQSRAGLAKHDAAWAGSIPMPLDSRAIGRYRDRLTDRQIRAVQRIAKSEMQRLGYAPVDTKAKPWWILADAGETAALRFKRLVHSARKRAAL